MSSGHVNTILLFGFVCQSVFVMLNSMKFDRKRQIGLIEVLCIVNLLTLMGLALILMVFTSNIFIPQFLGIAMALGISWLLTLIPGIVAAIIGLRSVKFMTPVAGIFRRTVCVALLVLNALIILIIVIRTLVESTG